MTRPRQTPMPEVSCEGKEKLTAKLAKAILRRRVSEDRMQLYHCEHCGFWHLGLGSKRMPAAMRVVRRR